MRITHILNKENRSNNPYMVMTYVTTIVYLGPWPTFFATKISDNIHLALAWSNVICNTNTVWNYTLLVDVTTKYNQRELYARFIPQLVKVQIAANVSNIELDTTEA